MLVAQSGVVVPVGFMEQNFEMDWTTERILRGHGLREGMVGLIEEAIMREDPSFHVDSTDHICDKYRCPRIKATSQWCVVTKIERRGEITSFIGVYSDATQRSRTYNESFFWLVKIEG